MDFRRLTTAKQVLDAINEINGTSKFAYCDTESTGLNVRQDRLVDVQVAGDRGPVYFFDAEFAKILTELRTSIVFWNAKFDLKLLFHSGVDLRDKQIIDAMLLDHLDDENRDHDLDSRIKALYSDDYKSRFWEEFETYEAAPADRRMDYSCRDVYYLRGIHTGLVSSLNQRGVPDSLVEHVHATAHALLNTELRGVRLDLDYCTQIGTELKTAILSTEHELRKLGGIHCDVIEMQSWVEAIDKAYTPNGKKWRTLGKPEFNFSSSRQVQDLLYNQLKLPVQKNEKTKKASVDDKALERLEDKHPIIPELRKLRKFSKMHTAFIEGVLSKSEGGRIYPSFNLNGTVTGRLSHSNPNLAQMPSRGEWSKIRGIFIPSIGRKMLSVDFAMLEVVIAAHFSRDRNLLSIVYEGASKHDITAQSLGVDRATAKTLNFALQYQCSPRKVANLLGTSLATGEHLWNKYWDTYSGERRVIDECNHRINQGLPIVTPFGRQRHFPAHFKADWEREAAYRQGYSALIQGTGADLCNWSFYTANQELRKNEIGHCLWSVHDEIVAEVDEIFFDVGQKIVQDTMVRSGKHINLSVPLTTTSSGPLDRWTK